MKIINVEPGQNLTDIALQYYGDADSVIEIARDNNIVFEDATGFGVPRQLKIDETKVVYKHVVNYMDKYQIKPANLFDGTEEL